MVKISLDQTSGVYEPGQDVTWTVTIADGSAPASGKFDYKVLKGGLTEMAAGTLDLVDGKAQTQEREGHCHRHGHGHGHGHRHCHRHSHGHRHRNGHGHRHRHSHGKG